MYESVPLKSVQTSSRFNDSHYLVVHETLVVMHAVYLTVCTLFSLENTAHKTDQLYINLWLTDYDDSVKLVGVTELA